MGISELSFNHDSRAVFQQQSDYLYRWIHVWCNVLRQHRPQRRTLVAPDHQVWIRSALQQHLQDLQSVGNVIRASNVQRRANYWRCRVHISAWKIITKTIEKSNEETFHCLTIIRDEIRRSKLFSKVSTTFTIVGSFFWFDYIFGMPKFFVGWVKFGNWSNSMQLKKMVNWKFWTKREREREKSRDWKFADMFNYVMRRIRYYYVTDSRQMALPDCKSISIIDRSAFNIAKSNAVGFW